MHPLLVLVWPALAVLGALGLLACAPRFDFATYLLPVVRTVALITVAAAYVAAVWSH